MEAEQSGGEKIKPPVGKSKWTLGVCVCACVLGLDKLFIPFFPVS